MSHLSSDPNKATELPDDEARWAWSFASLLFGVGLAWRAIRYFHCFPLWRDELAVVNNLLDADYESLIHHLGQGQIAPILFLWGELACFQWLGPDVLSMRLLPFVAGCTAAVLAWIFYRLVLPPRPRLLAFGLLAVATWPVTYTECLKPYSLDLCMSLALLVIAVLWFRDRGRVRGLVMLTAAAPVAVLSSYPSVFVAGGVSLFVAAQFRRLRLLDWFWLAAYNLSVLASFLAAAKIGERYLANQYAAGTTSALMSDCWSNAFPPADFLGAARWFFRIHVDTSMSYPFGRVPGTGVLTAALCLIGVLTWRRVRQVGWALLVLGPFALHLVAASVRRYPYGTEARVMQHLVPLLCLMAGLGLARLVDCAGSEARRRRLVTRIVWGLVLFGVGNAVRETIRKPLHIEGTWARGVVDRLEQRLAPGDVVIISAPPTSLYYFEWHLKTRHPEALWRPDAAALERVPRGATVWVWASGTLDALPTDLEAEMQRAGGDWSVFERVPIEGATSTDPDDLVHFVRIRRN